MHWIKYLTAIFLLLVIGLGLWLYQPDLPATEVDARYSNEQSKFLQLDNGTRLHYRDQGNPDGIPIVLLHGAMSSLHTWEPWVGILGADYRVITLDLPGHGLTGAVPDGDYSADAFTQAIDATVVHLQLEQFVLGGNSMGGGATWRYTLRYPDKVSHMLLVASVGASRQPRPSSNAQQNSPFAPLQWAWFRSVAEHINPRVLVARGLRSAYNNAPVVDDVLINRYTDLILRQGTRKAILQRAQRPRSQASTADLSMLSQPTLILWGAHDALIPVSVGEQLRDTLADARLVVYEDLGHVPMEEAPQRTAMDVLQFLSEATTPSIR